VSEDQRGDSAARRPGCGLGHERCKRSVDITEGDVIVAFGMPHLIRSIEPYVGPFDFVTGVARAADGWGISLTTTGCLEVA
jgi:hypothetical protein